MSSASIKKQIAEVEKKIAECKTSKSKIESAKSQASSKKDGWEQSYRRLSGELKEVKRTDVFEGEIADALKDRVGDADEKIKTGLSKAAVLLNALSRQMSYLVEKIRELEEEKRRLEAALEAALAEEREAREAARRSASNRLS